MKSDMRCKGMECSGRRHSPPGFTLVEIMVSMFIALIVMGGVYQTLLDENIGHDRGEKILDMQNNARVAMGRIVKDVRRAGFLGCGGAQAAETLNGLGTDATMIGRLTIAEDPPGLDRNFADYSSILTQLVGTAADVDYLGEALGFSDNAPSDHDFYQAGTDALTLVYLSSEQPLMGAMGAVTNDIPVGNPAGFDDGDILYVTDCDNYSLFQKTGHSLPPAPPPAPQIGLVEHDIEGLNNNNDLVIDYGALAPARLFKLNTSTYFLKKDDFTLCHNDTDRPIASNIEDLQFEFLFDDNCAGVACTGGDGSLTDESWTTGLGAHTSKDVRAVRIWLLAMSDTDFTFTDTNNYNYPSSPYCSAAWNDDPLSSCSGTGSPASLAPIASPANGEHRHRYLASAVVYLRNAGLK